MKSLDKKKTKELDWEQPLRDRVAFIGNEIPEYFTTDKRSKTVYLGCPNDLIKDYKRLATQQRTELLEGIKKIVPDWIDNTYGEINSYTVGRRDERIELRDKIINLLNKKDE